MLVDIHFSIVYWFMHLASLASSCALNSKGNFFLSYFSKHPYKICQSKAVTNALCTYVNQLHQIPDFRNKQYH